MTNRQYPITLFFSTLAGLALCAALLTVSAGPTQAASDTSLAAKISDNEQNIAALEQEIKYLPIYIKSQVRVRDLAQSKRRSVDQELGRTRTNYHETVHLGSDEAKIENARFKLYLVEKKVAQAEDVLRDTELELKRREQLLKDKKAELEQARSKLGKQQAALRAEQERQQSLRLQNAARETLAREKAAQRKLANQKAAQLRAQEEKANKEKELREQKRLRELAESKARSEREKEKAAARKKRNTNGVYSIFQDDVEVRSSARNGTTTLDIYPQNNRNEPSTVAMKFIGRTQYRAEAEVTAGANRFVIGAKRWSFNIPTKDNGATYVFIFDTRKNGGKRLVLYNKDFGKL